MAGGEGLWVQLNQKQYIINAGHTWLHVHKYTIQYNTINNLYCTEYLTKLSLRGALQV